MSERQNDMPKDRQTDRQIEDKTTFQLSYQNKSCSECQHDASKLERHADRQSDRQTDRQTERQIEDKTTFQLSYQNKTCSEC